jgi:hypothetical protein
MRVERTYYFSNISGFSPACGKVIRINFVVDGGLSSALVREVSTYTIFDGLARSAFFDVNLKRR